MSTVQQALMAREERKKKEQQEGGQDKVTTALNKRKLRLESTLKDSLADLQNRINEEVTAYNSISKPDFGSGSLKNTLDYTRQSRVNLGNLVKEAESYRKYLGDEKTNDLVALLDSMQKGYGSLLDTARLYEYFKSEEDFNAWKNKESFIKEYMENPEQALKSDSYEESWVKEAEQRAATNTALQAEDFEHYSKLGESIENPTYEDAQGWLSLGGWHPFGEDVGNIVTFSRENKDRVAEQLALSGRVPSSYDVVDYDTYQMTQDEVSAYNYYLAKYGKDKAEEYLEGLRKTLRERAEGIGLLSFSELAKEHPVLASAWSVGTNLFSGPEYLINLFREDDTRYATAQTQVIRQTVSEKVDWEIGNWDAFDFLYNTGMSAIDSAAATALFGKFGGIALGLSAAASATNEALDRGLSNKQAFWTGLFAGVFEGLFETVSIGNFNSLKQGVSTGLKSLSKNVAKSMLVNASEETFTEIANIVYDTIANGDLSNYEILVRRYMEQGLSETEAKKKSAIDLALQVTEAGASGALMGFGFGAVGGISQIYNANRIGNETYGGFAKELIDEALEIDPENPLAKKLQKKLENQKNPSGASLYTLAQQNEETMVRHDLEKISRAVEQRLIELGEKGDVRAISAVLAKKAAGEKLKASEKNALKKSSFGEQVLKELDPEKIRSGEQASSFAEKIGTERINAEEYGRLLDAAEAAQERNISEEDHFLDEEQKSVQGAQSKVFKASPSSVIENKQAKDGSSNALKTEEAEDEPSVKKNKAEKKIPTLLELSEKYGAQAGAMVHTYISGQNPEEYDTAYRIAYDMGKSGVALSYALKSQGTSYLTENQRELAYEAGKDASDISAREREEKNRKAANGNTGRRKGILKGDGVTVSELQKSFNDTQKIAYKLLSAYAEATGIDIVLYKSEANQDGVFEGAQGRFEWKENTIYLDINAGLSYAKDMNELAKYTMLRTFSHEFTHFIEKWNPMRYNEFRKLVFATLTEHGENVDGLIEKKKNLDKSGRMTYEEASREVVAEAMTDILPDSDFLRDLAQNHKSIFEKLLEKMKEFKERLRDYFNTIGLNPSREANALKEQLGDTVKYFDSIVRMFDRIALEAVENYQQTVAMEEVKSEAAEVKEEVKSSLPAENIASTDAINTVENADLLTEGEKSSLLIYKSGGSYALNAKLRDGAALDEHEEAVVLNLDSALEKLPTYNGKVYRSIQFDGFGDQKARDAFVAGHIVGGIVPYVAYTSSSTVADGYPLDGNFVVHLEIESTNGRNMEGYGNNFESEVLFPRESKFITDKVVYAEDGTPTIYLTEAANEQQENHPQTADGRGSERTVSGDRSRESRSRTHSAEESQVQRLHTPYSGNGKVQSSVSAGNTERDHIQSGDLQGVQAEVKASEYDHFTITDDAEGRVLSILFDGKPTDAVREVLKANAFVWNKKKGEWFRSGKWYNRSRTEDVVSALQKAYEAEAPAKKQEEAKAPEAKDAYSKLSEILSVGDLYKADGRTFSVSGNDKDGYYAAIKRDAEQNGAYPIANARDLIWQSRFATRQEAVADLVGVARNNDLLTTKEEIKQTIKEGNSDGREEAGTVLQHRSDGEGASRLLAEVETEAVQGTEAEGDLVADTGERRDETGRHDLGADAERHERGHGEGSGESRDLRRDDELTSKEAEKKAEALHTEVEEQIAKKSTEQPKGRNFVIGDSLNLPIGEKARYKANVEAIRLVKKLEAEGRYATEAEQELLSKYIGWGGLANAFDERKSEWSKEFRELKELLTDEEYASARSSTLNAHYTDISVIKAMYDGLSSLGFTGGRMLEPSSGVGNFVGAMPANMSSKVKSWTMVELDGITGRIAKYLYPNADVRIEGFEKANIPDNFMDVAIGNVPFGNYSITDKAYPKKVTSAIHNYFFAKSLDKVRPGGIVMFITSSYTLNSKDETVRRYIMGKADLLGAIRLPGNAFKGNAGTEVVTDILILKKREAGKPYAGVDFLEAPYTPIPGERYNGAYINSYFNAHPDMVLGTPTMTGGMYRGGSLTYRAFTDKGSLADQIREAFTHIEGKMEYPAVLSKERTNFAVERADKKTKQNGLVVKDGRVYQNSDGVLTEKTVSKDAAERIKGLLSIRDAAKELMFGQQQGLKESEIKKARTALNKAYDDFVKKNGYINAPRNRNAIKDDPEKFSLFALENYNPDTKKGSKADIFYKNTIAPNRTVTYAKDVFEGLIVSRNENGGVDLSLISRLTGKSEDAVRRELLDSRQVFLNRDGELEAAEVYLSGNVRAKLREAKALVPMDADYQKNVEALESVMPKDVPYHDIFVNPGTPWIPASVYSDFAAYMLGGHNSEYNRDVEVTRNNETGNFTVELKRFYLKTSAANTQKWGTSKRSFLDLFDAMLNSRSVVVRYKTDDGHTVVDKDATAAANEKLENITKEFQDWLWRDEKRRNELSMLYNETFNAIVTPKYNGDNLTVNGANAMKPLRPHQRNAVQRVISSGGNTLLAHKVGAGKTYEMAAAAMKLKQLGLVKKPLFAVPKSLVAQWGNEFMDFFPTAKLLVAEETDFTAENRKVFANRIATGDYDAVIVSYEQFEKLPISNDFARALYEEQINAVIDAIEEAKAEKGGKAPSVKDLEKKRKSLQEKMKKLSDVQKDEDNIEFEQLGVDSLFIDEAHNFKNLFYTTSMTNVSGLGNKDGSKRAFDLYTKVRYLQKLNGGKGIVFATATPVMNSMSEMYIMQKYLQPDLLDQLGLSTFDAWAKQFGEVVNGVEIKPNGQGYRVKQSFSRFKNISELQLLFRSFADVLTDIPELKIPKMKGGKVNVVVCEPGQFQKEYMKELEKRADNIKNVDPSVDNMLKITSDGRKISYTQRMIDPSLPYEEGCKIYRCSDNVVRVYNDSRNIKGTQLIFCDMATPKSKSKSESADTDTTDTDMENARLYDDIRERLVEGGIPAKEIAFIHEADTDQKKKKLFSDMNDGNVRVLIGSTGKMGVGMNAQKRVVAIHHLDAPWRPGDVEQRNGRAFRQGNINEEVACFTYVTEGSFDARLWDILERKQNFINQVMNGENVGREAEDTGEVTLSAAEVKALASGSPLILEQVQLDTDIKKLESLYRAHNASVRSAKERLVQDKGRIAALEEYISAGKEDATATVDTFSEGKFSITVGKKKYTEKKSAGIALMAEATAKAVESGYTDIGSFAGFQLLVVKTHEGIRGLLKGKQGYAFNTYPGNTTYMVNHLIGVVEGIPETVNQWESELEYAKKDCFEQEKLISEPFSKATELEEKRARYIEVMEILNPKEEQQLGSMEEDAVQEQSREYLESEEKYSYEWFVHKPDMEVTEVDDRVKYSRSDIVSLALKNAASVGYTNENGNAVVYAEDMDTDVIVPKTLYQQRQNTLTDREVLEFAASQLESSELSEGERDALGIFRSRLEALKVLQEKRAEQGRLYKEQQFGAKVDRKAAEETLNRMHILDDQIKRADANVLSVENKEVFKRVLQKARRIVEVAQRKHDDEKIARWIDRRNNASAIRKYRERLREDTEELKSWILHPDNKDIVKHVPDVLKASVIPFLKSIDFTSKRALAGGNPTKADEVFIKDLNALQSALKKNLDTEGLYSGYNDLPPDFMDNLNHLIQTVETLTKNNSGEFVINQMTSEELKELSKVVRVLKTYIKQTNSFLSNAMFEHVYDAGDSSIGFMSRLNTAKHTGKASEFLLWKQIRPAYAFERFGKGGVSIYDGLRRGQATLAFNTKEIKEFAEKAYTAKEVEEWSKVKTVSLGGEQTVKMRISQIMSFYELYKQEDSKRHILDGGIRISTFKDGGKKISDNGHTLTEGEAERIIGLLTPRQKEVADKLQKYMQDKGSRWGNDVSVKRFGEELFGEENYFPINSDGRHLQTSNEEHPSAASLYALLNMSFTKSRNKEANNRIVIYDIFDVFSNHMASMAQYNALALPVLDAVKWLNYRQVSVNEDGSKTVLGSVREQMAKAFGVPEETRPGSGNRGYAEEFVLNIIKAFNGTEAQGVSSDTAGLNSLRRYNMAQVAFNFRVVLQQPLAITRAGLLIDYSSILKGLTLKPAAIKKNIEEMQKYSGIAVWKSLGFYDVNISRGLSEIIKHKSTVLNKIGEVGMWGAEKADLLTWSAMWSACKEEVIRKQSLTPKSDGFYEAVTELFEDVIYKTQVVDSVLTKNEFLRSKGFFARAVGSFMSEPTATASMVIDAFDKYNMDLKRGMTKTQAWSKNGKKIGRTVAVYSISAIMLATVQAVADALRDDDDYESFLEKFLEAFAGDLLDEMMPLNKLPILSDFYELAKEAVATWTDLEIYGNPPQTVFMQWYDSLVKGMDILHDKIWGEDTNYSWYGGIYKLLQAASGISGLPMAAVTREIVTAWNNTIGAMAPSLQVKTYEPSELSKIRYAYEDGYLTAEEATRELLRQGLVETQEEAYFTIQGWEYGEGYSRYQKIYDAVRNGGDFEGAMKELTSHGYKEKEVLSNVKGQIGTWYKDGQISKQQAIDMLSKYFNMDSYEIAGDVNRWSCKVVTGIEYTEIKDEFLQGNITAARAVEMRMRYGGETKENATATVNKWRAEKETGIEYNSIEQAFFDGKISKADAKNMYITYGGFSEEKANEKVTVLDFSKKHPQLEANDLTFSMVRAYNTYCESTGVGVKVFYEAWAYKNSVSGSKESTMLYIDRLPLTAVQKDSLYYAFGWAESKIFEAPWH